MKFGRLEVVQRDLSKPIGHGCEAYWLCQCDCSKEQEKRPLVSVKYSDLARGHTKSCGCYRKEVARNQRKHDLLGYKIGFLEVLEETNQTNSRGRLWKCLCHNCNNIYYCDTDTLVQKKVMSCGCLRSKGEFYIQQWLINHNFSFSRQYVFPNLPKRFFDFRVELANGDYLLIEYDGEQHTDSNSRYYSEEQVERDKQKDDYCLANNIKLIRISYKDFPFLEEKLSKILLNK